MIRVVATFHLKPEEKENSMVLFKELVERTREEDGCVAYDLAQSAEDENVYVILEAWKDQHTLDVHSASEHFNRLVPQLAAACIGSPSVKSFAQVI